MSPESRPPAGTRRAVQLLLSMGEEFAGRDPVRAMECFQEAAELARDAQDSAAEAAALRQLGTAAASRGETARAEESLQRALGLARDSGEDLEVAGCLNALAFLRSRQGDPDDALVWLRESLGRTTDAPRDPAVAAVRAETLENLGALYRDKGDPQQALVYYQEALEIRRVAGDEAGIAACRNHLGTVCYRMGRFADAETHFVAALEARRSLDDR
ncbi:MAG: tetratricopeptide repeat protein, partial [Gemmatimonadetes bacterium]|nr:tetratricopeptide repeat protein [Gemmatimonadota bacterium]